VRCIVDADNDAHEITLDENVTRLDIHPADQCEAFPAVSTIPVRTMSLVKRAGRGLGRWLRGCPTAVGTQPELKPPDQPDAVVFLQPLSEGPSARRSTAPTRQPADA